MATLDALNLGDTGPDPDDDAVDPPLTAIDARDIAIAQVTANANAVFAEQAYHAVVAVAHTHPYFTTDAVWEEIRKAPTPPWTHDNRAVVGPLNRAKRDKLIAPTPDYEQSNHVTCHARPKRVWKSLILGGA